MTGARRRARMRNSRDGAKYKDGEGGRNMTMELLSVLLAVIASSACEAPWLLGAPGGGHSGVPLGVRRRARSGREHQKDL
eukprot:4442243-Pyramimonas_sp.AAC.1